MLFPKLLQTANNQGPTANPMTTLSTGVTVGCDNGYVYRGNAAGTITTYSYPFANPILAIGNSGGEIIATDGTALKHYPTGTTLKYNQTTGGSIDLSAEGAASLYAGIKGNSLYRYDYTTGNVLQTINIAIPFTAIQNKFTVPFFAAAGNILYRVNIASGTFSLSHNIPYDAGQTIKAISSSISSPSLVYYGGTGGNLYRADTNSLASPILIENVGSDIAQIDVWQNASKMVVVTTSTGKVRSYFLNSTGDLNLLYEIDTGGTATIAKGYDKLYTFVATSDGKVNIYNNLGQLHSTLMNIGSKINAFVHG